MSQSTQPPDSTLTPGSQESPAPAGPGRAFTFIYGVFAVGASSRAIHQLATRASEAPLAYTLSALAALVYVIAFVLLLRWGRPRSRQQLRVVCLIELAGVLLVGTLSVVAPQLFPHASVWSYYGAGYLLAPAVLPVLVLRWLRRTAAANDPQD